MTESDENQLTPRQLAAIPFFASCSSVESACKESGISKDTYYKWLKGPLFKSELDSVRNQIVDEAINQLKVNTTKAAMTLSALLDRDDSPAVQRSSANDILNHVSRFRELQELEERIKKLESLSR